MGKECPRCGRIRLKEPLETNSISIEDKKTYICSDCGISETRIAFFLAKSLDEKIPSDQKELTKKFRERLGLESHS